ncbi:hypothetical protein SAMN05421505_10511 [Sinosporangium album]|uniref:Uncharacterized protein n=1 Tax=Sinosporangium album TaxID=504805 RepID=A0A1G7UWX9_9ACTN|nr:hypothetical protein [Sinosporangium album]SDG52053.1 hypothetical protein SAMN05421505_10511 [Sinosporangium album]
MISMTAAPKGQGPGRARRALGRLRRAVFDRRGIVRRLARLLSLRSRRRDQPRDRPSAKRRSVPLAHYMRRHQGQQTCKVRAATYLRCDGRRP